MFPLPDQFFETISSLPFNTFAPMDFEHPKSPNYMDSAFSYDPMGFVDPYMSPYVSSLGLAGTPAATNSPDFSTLNLSNGLGDYTYSSNSGASYTASPARPFTPQDGVSPPALYSLSAEDISSDHSSSSVRRGSGSISPPNVPYGAASVPRSHRFNPIAAPTTRSSSRSVPKRRASRRDDDSDEDDDDFQPSSNVGGGGADMRRETIRRQRIESEQRRRDELREGYRRLKDSLPVSNQKSSKVSLLDRATTHIKYLEVTTQQLQTRLQQAEAEVARLRNVNEALMLGTAEQRQAVAAAAAAAVVQQSQASF